MLFYGLIALTVIAGLMFFGSLVLVFCDDLPRAKKLYWFFKILASPIFGPMYYLNERADREDERKDSDGS